MVNKQVPNKNSNKIQEIQNYKEFIITKKKEKEKEKEKKETKTRYRPLFPRHTQNYCNLSK